MYPGAGPHVYGGGLLYGPGSLSPAAEPAAYAHSAMGAAPEHYAHMQRDRMPPLEHPFLPPGTVVYFPMIPTGLSAVLDDQWKKPAFPDPGVRLIREFGNAIVLPDTTACPITKASPQIRLNRVPPGYTAVLIDLNKFPPGGLKQYLHSTMCTPSQPGVLSQSRCGCELLEYNHYPDFMFKGAAAADSDESSSDEGEDEDNSDGDHKAIDAGDDCPSDSGSCAAKRPAKRARVQETIAIKRPPNAFMIFRSRHHKEMVSLHRGGNKVVSRIIGRMWRNLSPEEQRPYREEAERVKAKHQEMYPNYRYRPRRS
ncbi:Transcription factor SOX-7 [Coemansia javaensis]|uniref:Transcription factor SOX-7 n=1 Tax=Coemansia javaensis TaxID=2761396 RepID=A0A9W8HEI3_9FUNG|nr:Transcription factor SOX-7 [Coemansia javaensis]